MSSGISAHGLTLEAIFDPYVAGTAQAAVTGIGGGGSDLNAQFAKLSYGTAAAATGISCPGGDLNTQFAAKGTAVYTLPINGTTYTRSRDRGSATLDFNVKSDGTYSIVNDLAAVLASGTWLPSGDSVSSYTCTFAQTGMVNGADPGGGSDFFSNSAVTAQPCTTSQDFQCGAAATTVSTNASNGGTVTLKLYKSGVLRFTTTVTFECSAAG